MAGINRRAIANPLFSPQSVNHVLGGVFGMFAQRCGPQWRQHHHHYQPQRSLVSMNAYCNNDTFITTLSTTKAIDQPTLSKGKCRIHSESSFPIFNARIERRCSHTQSTSESQPETHNIASEQNKPLERRPKSDPTAKRPTVKCDPYGLQGESLSYIQCSDWMSTLEDGWVLLESENDDAIGNNLDVSREDATIAGISPIFLQKQYNHTTFHEASQFLSHISLIATNLNHFPFLSMERILVDDLNKIHGNPKDKNVNADDSDNGNTASAKRKRRKTKGWIFRSTIRCSTYRPSPAGSSIPFQNKDESDLHRDKGLTYHDFHLAMSIDVEVGREELKRLLWSDSQD
mmetsp:Transcript_8492/g.19009  ORF Transcript_8492/g.19009 Transcript_8492/m.19009 type:complete len:345 (-) Transcript_8492:55-1089(-)